MGQWIFQQLGGAAVRRDPNEAELFKTEQAEEGEYAGTDALVREILQNSIDAKCGDGPVRVRIAVHEPDDAPPPNRMADYLGRLRNALTSRGIEFGLLGDPLLPPRFLVVEDFGTRGLGGDPHLSRDPAPGDRSRQDFFWFWRNIGRSGKTGDDLGRWGLGKTVYRAVSRVGCMLGLTVRACDSRQLLMGQAVLKIHEYEGKEFAPEGYWCDGSNRSGLPLPIEGKRKLQQFRKEWKLTRADEPGLSVVVPYIAAEVKAYRILQAVAVHFFARVLRGELVVEVVGSDVGRVLVDADGIEAACAAVQWDGPKRTKRHVSPPIAFAREALTREPGKAIATRLLGTEGPPELTADSFDPVDLAKARREFSNGSHVTVRVMMQLQRRHDEDCEGCVDVHLQRHADGERRDTYFVREGMTITKINSQAALRGVQALVVVDTGPLASLLGDAEGPAHEDWDTSEERPDRVWKNWKGRVKFIRRIVDALVEQLSPPADEPDFDLLSEFFSIDRPQNGQQLLRPLPSRSNEGDRTDSQRHLEPIPSTPRWFRVTDRSGGFSVVPSKLLPVPAEGTLRVAVAYDLPSGDPIRNWSKFDFEFTPKSGPLKFAGRNVQARIVAGNVMEVTVQSPEFAFVAEGFDRHRDLFVRVDEIRDGRRVET